jgi:thiamine kinase-like enzyme
VENEMKKIRMPIGCTFPQLAEVLDTERFAPELQWALDLAATGAEIARLDIQRVFYKPDRRCRVLLEAHLRGAHGESSRQLYFGDLRHRDEMEQTAHGVEPARLHAPPHGRAVALLPRLAMRVWAHPNDPWVPGVAVLADPSVVRALLQREPASFGLPPGSTVQVVDSQLVKYVPTKRCGYAVTVHWRTPSGGEMEQHLYAKLYGHGRGRAAYDILRQIEASPAARAGRLRVPRPYAHDAEREIVWQEWVSGTRVADGDWSQIGARMGATLATFHTSPLDLGPGKDLTAAMDQLRKGVARLWRAHPQSRADVERLEARLRAAARGLPEVPRVPVHGSYKSGHLFEAEGRLVLIDSDGAGLGDPIYDVGTLWAQLVARQSEPDADAAAIRAALDDFRTAYAAGVPWGWPEARVRWYTSFHLLAGRAHAGVKRMAPERFRTALRCAEDWLGNGASPA